MNVYIIKGAETYDVTKAASNISWSYELDTLAATLSLSVASELFTVGDKVIIKHGIREIFRGIIISESGKQVKDFNCVDFAWYLNKNEIIIQFNKSTVYDAILAITHKFGISTELPAELKNVKITKLYKDELMGDIIRDLLDHATSVLYRNYYITMFGSVLAIRDYWRDPITVYGIGNDYSLGKSIENMSNKVVIVSSEEQNKRIYATVQDDNNISKYGLLQTIETVDAEDVSKARNMAKNKLKELNKVEEDISFTCTGNFDLVAGRRVKVLDEELKGEYLIKDVSHSYVNDRNYRCSLTVERWSNYVGE